MNTDPMSLDTVMSEDGSVSIGSLSLLIDSFSQDLDNLDQSKLFSEIRDLAKENGIYPDQSPMIDIERLVSRDPSIISSLQIFFMQIKRCLELGKQSDCFRSAKNMIMAIYFKNMSTEEQNSVKQFSENILKCVTDEDRLKVAIPKLSIGRNGLLNFVGYVGTERMERNTRFIAMVAAGLGKNVKIRRAL